MSIENKTPEIPSPEEMAKIDNQGTLENKKEPEAKEFSNLKGIFVVPGGESWVFNNSMGNIAVLPGAKLKLNGSFKGNIFLGEGAVIDGSEAQIQGRIITGEAAKKPIEDLSRIKQK